MPAYLRQSKRKKPSLSTDQLLQMRTWCKAQGHRIAMEYIEPAASTTDKKRPVFQQMI
ncbi:recombinase family protein [Candidatus Nitrotoga sp. M5]|uniref:recombinase family protein n=1 Tax=Candidatus Nitrotoga sp. M5 TaxID=2890409 RepID=UPI00403D9599